MASRLPAWAMLDRLDGEMVGTERLARAIKAIAHRHSMDDDGPGFDVLLELATRVTAELEQHHRALDQAMRSLRDGERP